MNFDRSTITTQENRRQSSGERNVIGQTENKPLTTTFVIGWDSWLEFYHEDIEYIVEQPPQGFYDSESVEIGVLLSNSFYVIHHWFYTYHHELLHHLLRTLEGEEASKGLDSIRQYMLTNNLPNPLEKILPLEELNVKRQKYVNDVDLALALVVGEDGVAELIFQKLVSAYGVSDIKWKEHDDCRNHLFRYLHVCISEGLNFMDEVLSYIEQYGAECVFIHSNQDEDIITDLTGHMDIPLFYCPLKKPKKSCNDYSGETLLFTDTDGGCAVQLGFWPYEPIKHLEGAGFEIEWSYPWATS